MIYRCFTRTWWKENSEWPNGLEPCAGQKKYVHGLCFDNEDDARQFAQAWNSENDPGRYSLKMEFESGEFTKSWRVRS